MKKAFRFSDARPDPAGDTHDEIGFHLEMRTREFIAQGLSPEAARQAALASFGDVAAVEAELGLSRGNRDHRQKQREWWGSLVRDIRVALRSFRRRPLYALSVIAALGLGIAAAGAVFAVVNGVLLAPLPYRAPDRLVMVWLEAPPSMGGGRWPLAAGFYEEFKTTSRSFSSIAAFRSWPLALGDFEEVEQLAGARVTPSLFATLGVAPLVGRTFTEAEGQEGGPRVAILSHRLWRTRFAGDPGVIGRTITLSGERFEVVGVMPADFAFPRGAELIRGLGFGARTEVWAPLVLSGADKQNYGTQNLAAVARLRDGVSAAAAHDDIAGIIRRVLASANWKLEIGNQIVVMKEQAAGPVRRGLLLLLGAVAAVLLIACANVAGLLSARVAERRREFAVRLALGARRPRVARQLITETLVLAVVGGALGVAGTWWGTRLLLTLAPADLPRADDIGFGLAVAVAIVVVSLLSGLAFGAIAVRGLAIASPAQALQGSSGRTTATRGARLGRRMLVAGQVAVSVLLLVGAGLLLRSFVRIQGVDPGFSADRTLTGHVVLPIGARFDIVKDGPGWARFFEQLMGRVAELPGVTAAGAVSGLPLTGIAEGSTFVIVGQEPARPEDRPRTSYLVAAGDYFEATGVPIVSGRSFDARDQAAGLPVAIISQSLATKYFGGDSPIGRLIRCGFEFDPNAAPRQVIGVVGDVKHGALEDEMQPTIYVPENQMPYPGLFLVVRTEGAPATVLAGIRRELKSLSGAVAISDVRTLEDVLRASLARQRFTLTLIGAFAAAALLLAVLGLYGVIAISVEARRRELGVRMALGARPATLIRMVIAEGMRLVGAGTVVGLLGALAVAGTLRALLFDVGVRDVAVYAAATAIVLLVGLVATYLPARAAIKASPTEALRPD